jgi:hypothetical protein
MLPRPVLTHGSSGQQHTHSHHTTTTSRATTHGGTALVMAGHHLFAAAPHQSMGQGAAEGRSLSQPRQCLQLTCMRLQQVTTSRRNWKCLRQPVQLTTPLHPSSTLLDTVTHCPAEACTTSTSRRHGPTLTPPTHAHCCAHPDCRVRQRCARRQLHTPHTTATRACTAQHHPAPAILRAPACSLNQCRIYCLANARPFSICALSSGIIASRPCFS